MSGQCLFDHDAPNAPETCVYGDYQGVVDSVSRWGCRDIGRYAPWRCYEEHYRQDCCHTCAEIAESDVTGEKQTPVLAL